MSEYPAYYAYPSAPPVLKKRPDPPRLHWGWVLGLSIITLGLFGAIWLLVMAIWAKKVSGKSAPVFWSIAYVAYLPGTFFLGVVAAVFAMMAHLSMQAIIPPLQMFARLLGIVLYLGAAYSLRSVLESSPIEIPIGGVMTFFFAPMYFQYHLFDFQWMPDEGTIVNPPAPENVRPVQVMGFHGPITPAEEPPSPPQAG